MLRVGRVPLRVASSGTPEAAGDVRSSRSGRSQLRSRRWSPDDVVSRWGRFPCPTPKLQRASCVTRSSDRQNAEANEYVPTERRANGLTVPKASSFSPSSIYVDEDADGLIEAFDRRPGPVGIGSSGGSQPGSAPQPCSWWSPAGNRAISATGPKVSPERWSMYPPQARLPNDEVYESDGHIGGSSRTPGPDVQPGTEPLRWKSTAFRCGLSGRSSSATTDDGCYPCWTMNGYSPGQQWNSIGAWAEPYPSINGVLAALHRKGAEVPR